MYYSLFLSRFRYIGFSSDPYPVHFSSSLIHFVKRKKGKKKKRKKKEISFLFDPLTHIFGFIIFGNHTQTTPNQIRRWRIENRHRNKMSWENAKDTKHDVLLSDWQQIQFRKQWAFVGCCVQFIFNRNKHDHFIRILPFLANHNLIKYAWDFWHFFFHNHKYARTLKYYWYSFGDCWTSVEQASGVGNMYANT